MIMSSFTQAAAVLLLAESADTSFSDQEFNLIFVPFFSRTHLHPPKSSQILHCIVRRLKKVDG